MYMNRIKITKDTDPFVIALNEFFSLIRSPIIMNFY